MGPQERTIFIGFGFVAMLIALILVYFFLNMFKQRRLYRQLQLDKLNAEINASELERNNIATELHNEIGPYLSSVKMRLDVLETTNPQNLASCIDALDKCVTQIRSMAKTLSPLTVMDLSFQEAINNYIHNINHDSQLKISFTEIDIVKLPSVQNNQVYRMLQEIILNTIKHAKAETLKIEISIENDKLLIRTADDGIGFDLAKIQAQHKMGLGLFGIQSRIDFLKGTMATSDYFSKGTRYNIRIPIANNMLNTV